MDVLSHSFCQDQPILIPPEILALHRRLFWVLVSRIHYRPHFHREALIWGLCLCGLALHFYSERLVAFHYKILLSLSNSFRFHVDPPTFTLFSTFPSQHFQSFHTFGLLDPRFAGPCTHSRHVRIQPNTPNSLSLTTLGFRLDLFALALTLSWQRCVFQAYARPDIIFFFAAVPPVLASLANKSFLKRFLHISVSVFVSSVV